MNHLDSLHVDRRNASGRIQVIEAANIVEAVGMDET
jgi:hypothetical protein